MTPQETLSAGTTEECSVIISDQTEHLPVISCAASNENYVSGVTAYSAHLLNKCALVKFNVTTPSNSPICITGMKNKVTVDFTQNTMTPSKEGEGVIMLPAGSGENVEKWAILLPQEALEEGEIGSAYSEDGDYIGIRPGISEMTENGYSADGLRVTVNSRVFPEGALGLFSVEENRQVYFSRGNLQYIGSASTPYWKFADYQWDCFGTTTGQNSNEQNVDRDLFGWGTSGYNHSALGYMPYSSIQDNTYYYAYDNWQSNLSDQTGQADWGYNMIINGGNVENLWRTLTQAEWEYVFNTRSTDSGVRFVMANVNGKNGVILLPDNWSISIYTLNGNNNCHVNYSINTISSDDWTTILENAGAVFLPAAGCRIGTSIYSGGGDYWSASYYSNAYSYLFYFNTSELATGYNSRFVGRAVRLVQDYNH